MTTARGFHYSQGQVFSRRQRTLPRAVILRKGQSIFVTSSKGTEFHTVLEPSVRFLLLIMLLCPEGHMGGSYECVPKQGPPLWVSHVQSPVVLATTKNEVPVSARSGVQLAIVPWAGQRVCAHALEQRLL